MNTEKILCAVSQVEQSNILFQQDSAAGNYVNDSQLREPFFTIQLSNGNPYVSTFIYGVI
jgi:hypothetical protein